MTLQAGNNVTSLRGASEQLGCLFCRSRECEGARPLLGLLTPGSGPGTVCHRREHSPHSQKGRFHLLREALREEPLTGNTLLKKAAFPREGKLLLVPAGEVKVEV